MGAACDHPLGVIPSPPDERDYPYPAFGRLFRSADLPDEYELPGISRVDAQGSVQSCVAHVLALAKDWQESRELGRPITVSRQWIYHHRPNSYYHQGPGMIPREALATVRKDGVVPEERWPGITERNREIWPAPVDTLLPHARPHNVSTYVRVEPSHVVELKSAVYTLGPVMYCVPLHANFAPDAEGRIPMPAGGLRGYHAMAIVGWRPGWWLVQNSWGSSWGQGGRCWMPWNYPALEVWSITDAETVRQRVVEMVIGERIMRVDGKPVEIDVAPVIVPPGRTMLPVRFVAEALGADVEWSEDEQRVRLTRKEYPWP